MICHCKYLVIRLCYCVNVFYIFGDIIMQASNHDYFWYMFLVTFPALGFLTFVIALIK